jgi:hypothetical protein
VPDLSHRNNSQRVVRRAPAPAGSDTHGVVIEHRIVERSLQRSTMNGVERRRIEPEDSVNGCLHAADVPLTTSRVAESERSGLTIGRIAGTHRVALARPSLVRGIAVGR